MVDVTDVAWVQARLQDELRTVTSVALEPIAGTGGPGDLQRMSVKFCDGSSTSLVLKRTKASHIDTSKSMGLAREATFYNEYRTLGGGAARLDLTPCLPRVYFAEADVEAGTKLILMEDLSSSVQAGYFCGQSSCLNWGKDLKALTEGRGFDTSVLTPQKITAMAYSMGAKVHAAYWQQESLRSVSWLSGASWLSGDGRDIWESGQAMVANGWAATRKKLGSEGCTLKYDSYVVDCLEAAIAKASPENRGWDTFQAELKTRPFTLQHGDFHPANFLVRAETGTDGDPKLVLVDWETVTAGSGPQDIAQFAISHIEPGLRAEIEKDAVQAYYAELCALNSDVAPSMSFEACWQEYVAGGTGRWLFFVAILAQWMPDNKVQYFHDVTHAFMVHHSVTPENVPMPRV